MGLLDTVDRDRELLTLMAGMTAIFAFNVWEHMPLIVPNHYTDVASVFWRDGIGRGPHLMPYRDFRFEYPVLVGLLVWACSYLGRLAGDFSIAMNYYVLAMDISLYPFIAGALLALYRLCRLAGVGRDRIWKAFLAMPSFLMFPLYNWDMIAVCFALWAIYFLLTERPALSAASLGLGMAGKLYPAILLPALALEEATWGRRLRYAALALAAFLLPNLPFMAANFDGWMGTWTYHMDWGIEDSWLIYLFHQFDKNAHYAALAVVAYLAYKGLAETAKRPYPSKAARVIERSFLMASAWLLGSYVVTPQMALFLLPFFALMPGLPLAAAYLGDVFNALIIAFWFTLQGWKVDPLAPASITQIFSLLRQAVWFSLLLYALFPGRLRAVFGGLFERVRPEPAQGPALG
jgi:hypothetical protein